MARSRKLKIRGVEREIALASNGVLQADVPLSTDTDNVLTKESDGYAVLIPEVETGDGIGIENGEIFIKVSEDANNKASIGSDGGVFAEGATLPNLTAYQSLGVLETAGPAEAISNAALVGGVSNATVTGATVAVISKITAVTQVTAAVEQTPARVVGSVANAAATNAPVDASVLIGKAAVGNTTDATEYNKTQLTGWLGGYIPTSQNLDVAGMVSAWVEL
jgi:hypothetical protein